MAPPTHMGRSLSVVTPVAYVVVFGELSPRAKTQYARFLVENNVQFAKRPSDGRFIANVHLEAPQTGNPVPTPTSGRPKLQSVSPRPAHATETRSAEHPGSEVESSDDDDSSDHDDDSVEESEDGGFPTHLRRYEAFLRQFGSRAFLRQSTGTYTIEGKLVRLMSDIYDARAEEVTSAATSDDVDDLPPPFAVFVRAYLKNRFGLTALVEQQALELTQGLAEHPARQDVELFSRFLEGEYDEETLAFFLRAREAAQQEVSMASALFRPTSAASARRRGSDSSNRRRRSSSRATTATATTWLSKLQIEGTAQRVFGAKNDDNFLQFVHNVRSFVVEYQTTRSMEQLLEFDEFLTVAVETFVNSQPLPPSEQSVSLSSTSKHAHDGQDLFDSHSSPSPSPLPPPPLPRTFGSAVTKPGSHPNPTSLSAPKSATCFHSGAQTAPSLRTVSTTITPTPAPFKTVHLDGRPKKPHSDEVENRLSSLLARMQQRQLQGGA